MVKDEVPHLAAALGERTLVAIAAFAWWRESQ